MAGVSALLLFVASQDQPRHIGERMHALLSHLPANASHGEAPPHVHLDLSVSLRLIAATASLCFWLLQAALRTSVECEYALPALSRSRFSISEEIPVTLTT